MKLSLKKRIGWTQVRGGNVLRVAQTHGVSTDTFSAFAQREVDAGNRAPRWPEGEKPPVVFAQPGDLALEILHANGSLCGYTYLSGDAIQLNCYDAMPFWFKPASSERFELPDLRNYKDGEEEKFFGDVLELLMRVKYSETDLMVFDYTCPRGQPPHAVAEALMGIYDYAPVENTPDPDSRVTHLFGCIRNHGDKGGIEMHFQPPRDASEFAATPFQIELALSAVENSCPKSA
jgi:hypothetical protein